MKKYLLLIMLVGIMSCSEKTDFGLPDVDIKSIENDFKKWWTYHYKNIKLSSDFVAIDNSSEIISKSSFLKSLTTGDFIPLKLISKDSSTCYKLFELAQTSDKSIGSTIKNVSKVAYKHFQMEGTNFPDFNFTDLDGVEFNNESIKGKIVVLKCWFIACRACVAEFPELNELVEKYQSREDIVFISLAYDSEEKLKQFLVKRPFSYKVASVQEDFMENDLSIDAYPTHFIIDKAGMIQKVVNSFDEMKLELDASGILD